MSVTKKQMGPIVKQLFNAVNLVSGIYTNADAARRARIEGRDADAPQRPKGKFEEILAQAGLEVPNLEAILTKILGDTEEGKKMAASILNSQEMANLFQRFVEQAGQATPAEWLRSLTDAAAATSAGEPGRAEPADEREQRRRLGDRPHPEVQESAELKNWSIGAPSATPRSRRNPVEDRSAESIGEPWVPPFWASSCSPEPSVVHAWTAARAGRPVASLETDSAPLLESMVAPLSASEAKRVIKMLRPRSREVLARAGIAELTGMRVRDLMSVRGVGPSTVADVVVTWVLRDHPRTEVRCLRPQDWRAGATLCAELGCAGRVRLGEIFHGGDPGHLRLRLVARSPRPRAGSFFACPLQ